MENFSLCLPLLTLWVASSTILGFFVIKTKSGRNPATGWTILGFVIAAVCTIAVWPENGQGLRTFHGLLLMDGLGAVVTMMVLIAGAATLGFASDYFKKVEWNLPEIPILILLAVSGMVVMATTDHLGVIFLGLEIMSLSLYVLCASLRTRIQSIEAGTKYYLTGAFASGIFLMGIALVFGATGEMSISAIGQKIAQGDTLALAGFLLLIVGFGFKISAVPFHQWAPDVYEGAPTPITGFMSTAVKLVGFAALLRVVAGMGLLDAQIYKVFGWLSVLTMLVGNIGALVQQSVKRMLAYSSVAHAGYLLLGVAALAMGGNGLPSPSSAVLFYLVAYTLMNLGAFGILSVLETREGRGLTFDDLAGLKTRQPLLAGAMLVFMLSLAGIPPAAGFLAKWKLFEVLADQMQGPQSGFFTFLVVILIVSSVIGLAYYLRVVVAMYMTPATGREEPLPVPARLSTALIVLCALFTLWLGFGPTIIGLGPEGLLIWVQQATL
jgi:NADH-quinone oxidoreductase subunit N